MNKRRLLIGAAVVAIAGMSAVRVYSEDKEENEQKISFEEAPAAVRSTLNREANGEKIKTLDKEQLNGKTVYEADVQIDKHNYEIVVDDKGLLLSKKLDNEDEEKSASKQKQEKDEDK